MKLDELGAVIIDPPQNGANLPTPMKAVEFWQLNVNNYQIVLSNDKLLPSVSFSSRLKKLPSRQQAFIISPV